MPEEPGLDGRHRDKDGQIHQKRDDTFVKNLRQTYGLDFLPGFSGDATLASVLEKTGATSLSQLIKEHGGNG